MGWSFLLHAFFMLSPSENVLEQSGLQQTRELKQEKEHEAEQEQK
jgi:hypothetical protein